MNGPRVLLAGGGSAGHVSPLLATATQISRLAPDSEVLVLGTADGLEADLVPAAGYELITSTRSPSRAAPTGQRCGSRRASAPPCARCGRCCVSAGSRWSPATAGTCALRPI